jgi:hypothetical protein
MLRALDTLSTNAQNTSIGITCVKVQRKVVGGASDRR